VPLVYDLTEEQQEIQRVCRDFAAREIRPVAAAIDEADTEVPWDTWHKAAAIGLTSFMLPEELGGGGLTDAFTGCLVQEELCHGCSGIGNLVTSNGFFAEPVLELGTDEQKERWLRPLAGERPPLTALATTEPDFGSDAAGMRTTAKRVDGGYVLSGQKSWISNGGVARSYVVFATVAPGTGHRGVTAFLLDRDDAGLSFGAPMRKMGQRAIVNTELFLEDCFVADDRRLGAAFAKADELLANSPFGVQMTKEVMWSQLEIGSLAAGVDLENRTQLLASTTNDMAEAIAAFMAKRPAKFQDQ
jgi:acyl-CoA dehydrogenase